MNEEKINAYLDLLYHWNKKINLTAVPREKAMETLIKPSLAMLELIPEKEWLTIFDIGSGGGIPAVPLAIHLPQYSFHLVESVAKKASFLTQLSISLPLENLLAVNERTEEMIKRQEFWEAADVITSRQVAADTVFAAARHLLPEGGLVILHAPEEGIPAPEGFMRTGKNGPAVRYQKTG